jgi:hypothetical protein
METYAVNGVLNIGVENHYYDPMMNLLCSEVKTIFALKFDS